tara:strand:+ start:2654 stop:2944 length:291 start_codon:yes stop_codon:yes gene_type:complete
MALTYIVEITLLDKEGERRIVRKGDKVDLSDVDSALDDEKKYLAERHDENLRRFLGDGPYEISQIGKWPCGGIMLYFKPTGAGAHARDFRYAGSDS